MSRFVELNLSVVSDGRAEAKKVPVLVHKDRVAIATQVEIEIIHEARTEKGCLILVAHPTGRTIEYFVDLPLEQLKLRLNE